MSSLPDCFLLSHPDFRLSAAFVRAAVAAADFRACATECIHTPPHFTCRGFAFAPPGGNGGGGGGANCQLTGWDPRDPALPAEGGLAEDPEFAVYGRRSARVCRDRMKEKEEARAF